MARAGVVSAAGALAGRVADEIEQQHQVLARWLGSACDREVLDTLRAAHTADFSMVTTDGRAISLDTLLAGLAEAGNARPGLRIDVRDIEVLVTTDELIVARFVEVHSEGDRSASRRVSAALRPDDRARNGLRWRHVHETAMESQP
ncbi:MAG: hypothetical protein GEU98_03010 [Pseudonocardiaceae bacterium]|nr:hypothetical protein [Pseudonocardiaceae bacterium]